MDGTILVATASQGVLRSSDDGTTWQRIGLHQALEFDAVVRCLAASASYSSWMGSVSTTPGCRQFTVMPPGPS